MSTVVTDNLENLAGTRSTSTDNVIAGCAKAWVRFNGSGVVAITKSYKVSSITDGGTGAFTINFTTAFPDANYIGTSGSNATISGMIGVRVVPQTTTTCAWNISEINGSGTIVAVDPTIAQAAFFTD